MTSTVSSDSTSKTCTACKVTKDRSQFHVRRASRDGLRPACIDCTAELKRIAHAADPEKVKSRVRRWRSQNRERRNACERRNYDPEQRRRRAIAKKYGLTLEQYEAMYEAQGGRCAICRRDASESRWKVLPVDHCHVTGKVRGLLCYACNTVLGLMKDSPERLRQAATYLESTACRPVH